MRLLKHVWKKVTGKFGLDAEYGAPQIPGVPDASVFQEMQSVEEAEWPLPETAPIVATGVAIQVNKPLRLKMRPHA